MSTSYFKFFIYRIRQKKECEKKRPHDSQYGPPPSINDGVLRLIILLDSEDVIECESILGYLHQIMEKNCNKSNNCTIFALCNTVISVFVVVWLDS